MKPETAREYARCLARRAPDLIDPEVVRRNLPVGVSGVDPELIIKEVDAIRGLIEQ